MNKFSKPPLTQKEKDKKAKAFLNFSDSREFINNKTHIRKKEDIKPLYLRVPKSYVNDIRQIMLLTGLSMNAVCIDLLRPAIKRKLREIKNDLL